MKLKKITKEDLRTFSKRERIKFSEHVNNEFNIHKGAAKDKLEVQVADLIDQTGRNSIWEANHNRITAAIANLMQEYGRMPSKNEIATKTDLSRQTVHKHLAEYRVHPLYQDEIEQHR
jgi:DNA invertase Pin-like site-specific DNA recombinase